MSFPAISAACVVVTKDGRRCRQQRNVGIDRSHDIGVYI